MNDIYQAASALLAGRGHRTWRVGETARAAIAGRAPGPCIELMTDADENVCTETTTATACVTNTGLLHIEALKSRSIEEALTDRGLTLEAVALAEDGTVVDPHNGLEHLASGTVRTIRPPEHALREQPELLLRTAGVLATTGLQPSAELRRFAHRDAGNVLDVTNRPRHWGHELNKILLGNHVNAALVWLHQVRVLQLLMPEVAAMVGFDKTCSTHHKDIWEHTRIVTNKAAPQLVVRWAALCHDIGKVWTRTVNKNGKVHFFRHEEHGALLFESIAHRVGLDAELTQRVSYLIENHSRVNLYQNDWSDSAVRRLITQTEGRLADLITFSKADFTTKRESRIRQMQRTMADLEARIDAIREVDSRVPPLKKGIGKAIIARFELIPSRLVGELKTLLEIAIEAGTLPERSEHTIYLDWLSKNAADKIQAAGGRL